MQDEGRNQKVFKYGNHDIAEAAMVPYRTVKEHRASGVLDITDLRSVAFYISAGCLRVLAGGMSHVCEDKKKLQRELRGGSRTRGPQTLGTAEGGTQC